MTQVGWCRLWNLSLASVLVLTLSNIYLTVRLLHNADCPHGHPGVVPQLPPPPPPHLAPRTQLIKPAPTAAPGPALPCVELYDQRVLNQSEETAFSDVNLDLGRWDSSHSYKMYDFSIVGDQFTMLSEQYRVCLATQGSLERLSMLAQVAHQWTGAISAAVFAAGEELALLRYYIGFLRKCYPVVRNRVSFHLAVPAARFAHFGLTIPDPSILDCKTPEGSLTKLLKFRLPETVKWRLKHPYPQNHLRNLARRNCQSDYVFLTDVDIIPSAGLTDSLDAFLKSAQCKGQCAYVVPTYELDDRVRFPRNKTDLIRLANKGLARPFHHKVFIYNQFATNFSRWQQTGGPGGLTESADTHISHNVTNFEFLYEPFYVAPDTVPQHDERFLGYGYTRNTQTILVVWLIAIVLDVANGNDEEINKKYLRISGGGSTTIDKFPHQVQINIGSKLCSGSILSQSWIISAAHCIGTATPSSISIRAGTTTLNSGGSLYNVSFIARHAMFSTLTLDYDFALLNVTPNIVFTNNIKAVAIPDQDSNLPIIGPVVLTGWGFLGAGLTALAADLHEVRGKVISRQVCNKLYQGKFNLTERMFCVGKLIVTPKGACEGDNGGPATYNKVALGVMTRFESCGNRLYPSIYSRISSVTVWIRGVVGVYEMFVAGYQFQVLSPIFTCHWGLQNKKSRPAWRERQNSVNRRHFDVFKREVFARYHKDPLRMLQPRKGQKPAAKG